MNFTRFTCLLVGAVSVSSCGVLPSDKSKVRTVHEVLDNIVWWNGSVVRVAGYMPECSTYDCTLFQSKREHEEFWRIIRARQRGEKTPDFLSIGYDERFDRKARQFAGQYVLVTGEITTKCRDFFGNKSGCLDRAPDIRPMNIQPVRTEAHS